MEIEIPSGAKYARGSQQLFGVKITPKIKLHHQITQSANFQQIQQLKITILGGSFNIFGVKNAPRIFPA